MATNFIQPGDMVSVTAPYTVTSGQGVQVGNFFGVAQHNAASGAAVQIHLEGVYSLTKEPSLAIAQGARVYWDNTNRRVTTNSVGNLTIGICTVAAAGSDSVVVIDQVDSGAPIGGVRAAVLSLVPTAQANTALTLTLPNCHILALYERTTTAYTGATATLQLGTTAAGVDIAAAASIQAVGVHNLTQVDASIASATPFTGGTLYATIVQTTPTAVGAGQLNVMYLPIV